MTTSTLFSSFYVEDIGADNVFMPRNHTLYKFYSKILVVA